MDQLLVYIQTHPHTYGFTTISWQSTDSYWSRNSTAASCSFTAVCRAISEAHVPSPASDKVSEVQQALLKAKPLYLPELYAVLKIQQ